VISQFWGSSTFHRMVEVIPRLAMCIEFLQRHPRIKIHGVESSGGRLGEVLHMFGIDPSRLVSGVVRAKIVYLPRSTPCGCANVQESQTAASIFHNYIHNNLQPVSSPNFIVLIRRSGERRFAEQVICGFLLT